MRRFGGRRAINAAARFMHSVIAVGWLALMSLLTVFGAAGIVVNLNQLRWQRHVAREMRSLVAVTPSKAARPAIAVLPPPVARYRRLAAGDRPPVHTLELRHAGTFCMSPTSKPLAIRGLGMNAERFMNKQGLRPWGGTYGEWREVSGMLVPFEATVTWQLESGPFNYAHWLVETMDYDVTKPLGQPSTAQPSMERAWRRLAIRAAI